MVKVGLNLFVSAGPRAVTALRADGHRVFLDLKLHDIPQTVYRAARSAAALRPMLLNVHALGGSEMIGAAAQACRDAGAGSKLLAVTILTSQDAASLRRLGIRGSPKMAVRRLARLAIDAGAQGLVASPQEARVLRHDLGPDPILVTPGVRPRGAARGDQKRVADPATAVRNGATYVVLGRPLWESSSPSQAAKRLAALCSHAFEENR